MPMPVGEGLLCLHLTGDVPRDTGQIDHEGGPIAYPTLYCDRSPVLGHNPMDHGQPDAGAFAGRFGRKKRVVDALHDVGGHALPRVPHGQPDMWAEMEGRILHGQRRINLHRLKADIENPSGLAHSVLSIRTQVNDDLVQLGWIGKHSAYLGINGLANLNSGGEGGSQQGEGLLDQGRELYGCMGLFRAPTKGEDLLYQCLSALARPEHFPEVVSGQTGSRNAMRRQLRIPNMRL